MIHAIVYMLIKFPVGVVLVIVGWSLTMSVLFAPVGLPMTAAGVLLIFPNRKRKVVVRHEREE